MQVRWSDNPPVDGGLRGLIYCAKVLRDITNLQLENREGLFKLQPGMQKATLWQKRTQAFVVWSWSDLVVELPSHWMVSGTRSKVMSQNFSNLNSSGFHHKARRGEGSGGHKDREECWDVGWLLVIPLRNELISSIQDKRSWWWLWVHYASCIYSLLLYFMGKKSREVKFFLPCWKVYFAALIVYFIEMRKTEGQIFISAPHMGILHPSSCMWNTQLFPLEICKD